MKISAINLNKDSNLSRREVNQNAHDSSKVSFRGKNATLAAKNANQLLSIAPEHGGLGLGNYSAGGLAVVTKEAEISWATDLGLDIRTILPYHSKSVKGNIMIARLPKKEAEIFIKDKKLPEFLEEKWIHEVPIDYKPKKDEFFAVIDNDAKNFKKNITNPIDGTRTKKSVKGYKFLMIEPTDVKGKFQALQEGFFKTEDINYRVFKQVAKVKNNGLESKVTRYFYHIPQVAAMRKAYTNGKAYYTGQIIGGQWGDLYYSNFCRAVADSLPQMSKKEDFNPANIWMHDRPMFPIQLEIARRSASGINSKFYRGYHLHSTLHNPGYDYQGYMDDITGFFKIIFNSQDYEKLKSRDDFNIILDIIKKDYNKRSVSENKRLLKVFGEYCKTMFDENGKANITMISIANRLLNPQFSTVGAVSRNYAEEMKEFNDIARGLRSKLASIVTNDVTNGSLPASVPIDQFGNFGAGENGLSAAGDSYTPYKPIFDKKTGALLNYDKSYKDLSPDEVLPLELNLKKKVKEIEKVEAKIKDLKALCDSKKDKKAINLKLGKLEDKLEVLKKDKLKLRNQVSIKSFSIKEAKEANKKWLLDLISTCTDNGKPDGKPDSKKLTKLFFKDAQILEDGYNVQGYLSKYDPKDKIFMNWGRPDPQKGFSTFTQGIYEFFKNKNISDEEKIHAKFLFGCGKGIFSDDSADKKIISTYMKKIAELENGKYAGNVMFVEGMIPNKLVGCIDFGFFTSRYEPCGITPFESYAGACPVASINTGGAPNFVFDLRKHGNQATGFLTDSAFLIEGEELKKLTGFDTEAVKKEIQGDAKKWTNDMEYIFQKKIDNARRKALAPQVSDLIQKCMSVSNDEYDMMAKNAVKQQIEWNTNALYNIINGKPTTANDAYMDIFGVKRGKVTSGKRSFTQKRCMKAMNILTGEFGDTTNLALETYKDTVKESVEKFAKNVNGKVENNSGFFKKLLTDRRTFYVAGAVALISGIAALAINRNNKDGAPNPGVGIGKSKIYFA